MKFEEKGLGSGNRADIVVFKSTNDELIIGVVEVKTYSKINPSIEKNAVKQICRYLSSLYSLTLNKSNWGKRNKRYFGCIVYTNDYPVKNSTIDIRLTQNLLSKEFVANQDIDIFSARPEELISSLQRRDLCGYSQKTLGNYFS